MKRDKFISFRTTQEVDVFLKEIAELDNRSVSSVIENMVLYFQKNGDAKKAKKELNK